MRVRECDLAGGNGEGMNEEPQDEGAEGTDPDLFATHFRYLPMKGQK